MSRSVRTDYEALQIFEKHPTADAYRVGAGFTGYVILAVEKRFSGAELVAEYWRKSGEFDALTDGYTTAEDGYIYESEEIERARLDTFKRFALNPSYDE